MVGAGGAAGREVTTAGAGVGVGVGVGAAGAGAGAGGALYDRSTRT